MTKNATIVEIALEDGRHFRVGDYVRGPDSLSRFRGPGSIVEGCIQRLSPPDGQDGWKAEVRSAMQSGAIFGYVNADDLEKTERPAPDARPA